MISAESYLERRRWGLRALEAYRQTCEAEKELGPPNLVKALVNVAIGVVVYAVTQDAVDRITGDYIRRIPFWVMSPSGNTTQQLPLAVAMRVIRKRGWQYAEVEPTKFHEVETD